MIEKPELIKEGRKLVTIRKINAIDAIEGADMIVKATVDGWDVVVKKGEFEVGDYCVFFEIDSFLPVQTQQFAFLAGSACKIDEHNVERFRLRTRKLRGVVSQGLALPVTMFEADLEDIDNFNGYYYSDSYAATARELLLEDLEESRDGIEQFMNVTKYERPDERNGGTGAGKCKAAGNFPIVIPKTDEERIQGLFGKYSEKYKGVQFRKSLKLDGSSQTIAFMNNPDFYVEKVDDEVRAWNEETQELEVVEVTPYPFQWEDGQISICSRNLALKFDPDSHFWKAALKDDIPSRLKEYCVNNNRQLAIQGENCGPNVQGNPLGLTEPEFFAFRVWDIDNKCFFDDAEFQEFTALIGINVVPQMEIEDVFTKYDSIKDILAAADIKNPNGTIAEGIVFKSISKIDGHTIHFKVINNRWLLEVED